MMNLNELAPAKINLTLDVIGKRADGYHNVKMVMQSIALYDTVMFEQSDKITLSCNNPELPTDERNLAYKAARTILAGTDKGARIRLEKSIPLEAGMAGGSSDAAAVLRGLTRLYNLNKDSHEILTIAKGLGADVPFCVRGGTALAEGIGEVLTSLPSPPKLWLLIIKPNYGMSTAEVYKNLIVNEIKKRPDTEGMLESIKRHDRAGIITRLCNVLEEVTFKIKPELMEIKKHLLELGAENALMSGSGPTIFGVFPDESSVKAAAKKVAIANAQVHVAHTL